VDPRRGQRAARPALWPVAGPDHGGWVSTRLGFSPQRPQRRALEQNPAAVACWLAETYPAIRAQARREGGVVVWLDEMGVGSDAAAGRSWAPVGQTPVIKGTGKRFRVNMISAISNQGLLRFRLFVGSFTGRVLQTRLVLSHPIVHQTRQTFCEHIAQIPLLQSDSNMRTSHMAIDVPYGDGHCPERPFQ